MIKIKSDRIILENELLSITIFKPGTFYSGSRFDWNGFITDITLNKKFSYCMPESLNDKLGSTGGCGLCGEFGINEPIGYDEIKPGEYFSKIGVGLLKKQDDRPYFFAKRYELQPYTTEISTGSNHVVFTSQPLECSGYAFLYQKTVSVDGNELVIDYLLKNVGEKTFCTTEYCHNFIGINRIPTGSGYMLSLPCSVETDEQPNGIRISDNHITFDRPCGKDLYFAIGGAEGTDISYWELVNHECGAGLAEHDSFTACKFAVWAAAHVISAETFIRLEIPVGNSQSWRRKYSFFEK